jgi:hypothetical protein
MQINLRICPGAGPVGPNPASPAALSLTAVSGRTGERNKGTVPRAAGTSLWAGEPARRLHPARVCGAQAAGRVHLDERGTDEREPLHRARGDRPGKRSHLWDREWRKEEAVRVSRG